MTHLEHDFEKEKFFRKYFSEFKKALLTLSAFPNDITQAIIRNIFILAGSLVLKDILKHLESEGIEVDSEKIVNIGMKSLIHTSIKVEDSLKTLFEEKYLEKVKGFIDDNQAESQGKTNYFIENYEVFAGSNPKIDKCLFQVGEELRKVC